MRSRYATCGLRMSKSWTAPVVTRPRKRGCCRIAKEADTGAVQVADVQPLPDGVRTFYEVVRVSLLAANATATGSGYEKAMECLDALVGCVAEAERRAVGAEISEAATEEILRAQRDSLRAALADARDALERIAMSPIATDQANGIALDALEVLGRLDQENGR